MPITATQTPRLGLFFLQPDQDGAEDYINQVLTIIDAVIQASVISATVTSTPGSPSEGDTYLVPATGWSGTNANKIAAYYNGAWYFIIPTKGWSLYIQDTGLLLFHNGTLFAPLLSAVSDITDASGGTAGTSIAAVTNTSALTDSTGTTPDAIIQAIPDPAGSPASASALQADLVSNTLLAIRNDIGDLTNQLILQQALNVILINAISSLVTRENELKSRMRASGLLT